MGLNAIAPVVELRLGLAKSLDKFVTHRASVLGGGLGLATVFLSTGFGPATIKT
jgi:hypothetical protein